MPDEIVTELESPEVTQEQVTTPPDETVESAEEKTPQEAEEKKFTQSELDEILQKRLAKESARAERRALKVYADKLETMTSQRQESKPTEQPNGKPTMAQYANVEDYVEAVADWKLEQREQASQKSQADSQRATVANKVEKIMQDAAKISGFDREAFDELPITDAMAYAILDSDVAAKITAHLTSNPEDAERISTLSPARQAAEIGKLEAKISSQTVKASNAPAPIKPIGNRGGAANSDLAKSSMEDYIAARAKQGARWAR
jgi:hypothetical protein